MFSKQSWSKPLVHILLPLNLYSSPCTCLAFALRSLKLDPLCASDRAIVPPKRPSTNGRTYVSFCSVVPWALIKFAAQCVNA